MKTLCSAFLFLLTAINPATAPKAAAATQPAAPPSYFQTPFQSESQFIVESIVSDVAEQIYYAANHRLPDKKYFSVTAAEKPGSPPDAPLYELRISLDEKHTGLILNLNVNGPIWSPVVYHDVVAALAQTAGLSARAAKTTGDTTLLSKLLDTRPETIERENQALSDALEKEFTNPELHEQAALLLGAFMLRDTSGHFCDIRAPLSRMTAHLAMAGLLSGAASFGINGRLAEATMLEAVNNQVLAQQELKSTDTTKPAFAAFARALQALNMGDYRPLANAAGRSRLESAVWFALAPDKPAAWRKLSAEQRQTIDFVRAANAQDYSVAMGHELLAVSIPLELQEIQSVYALSRHKALIKTDLIPALNELPEHCFSAGVEQQLHVRVIGWGQWAMFLQRHLCHAVQENFLFLESKWGVHDQAKQFAAQCAQQFGGLRLYPFVARFNCTDIAGYHKSVDDALKLTVAAPQLVTADCWNYLAYAVSFAALYAPTPNLHINEWFDHDPPPGTDFDFPARWNYRSLAGRPDAVARLEELHRMAPCDLGVDTCIINKKYNGRPTFDQALDLYQPVLPYSFYALRSVAYTVTNQPAQFEKYMLQVADLEPGAFYDLGNYFLTEPHKDRDKAAHYFDQGADNDPDSVRAAGFAHWRMLYYLQKGQTNKAREIVDFAGAVYSASGLEAKAYFMEHTSNYDGALEWYAKIEERYRDPMPLISFCLRYKEKTGNTRFDAEVEKRITALFPNGKEQVSLADFHGAPTDGTLIDLSTTALRSTGLKKGEVIVAVDGVRARNYAQYCYLRGSQKAAKADLIVWQSNAYHAVKTTLPKNIGGDYHAKKPQGAPEEDP